MRKLISGTLMSLNGVISSPHEWATEFDEASAAETQRQLERAHALLMGRGTYEIFYAKLPSRFPVWLARLLAGEAAVVLGTEARGSASPTASRRTAT